MLKVRTTRADTYGMKLSPTILAAVLLAALPSTATAAGIVSVPAPVVGQTLTDARGNTVTVQPGDRVWQVKQDAYQQQWQIDHYPFPDIPQPTTLPMLSTTWASYDWEYVNGSYTGGLRLQVDVAPRAPMTEDGARQAYCEFYTSQRLNSDWNDKVAKDATPASVYTWCAFTRHESDPAPAAPPSTPITEPYAKAVVCTDVAVGKTDVDVTSTGVGCYAARGIIARYVKSRVQPKGYVCVTAASGRSRAATCAPTSKATKRITGKWRR